MRLVLAFLVFYVLAATRDALGHRSGLPGRKHHASRLGQFGGMTVNPGSGENATPQIQKAVGERSPAQVDMAQGRSTVGEELKEGRTAALHNVSLIGGQERNLSQALALHNRIRRAPPGASGDPFPDNRFSECQLKPLSLYTGPSCRFGAGMFYRLDFNKAPDKVRELVRPREKPACLLPSNSLRVVLDVYFDCKPTSGTNRQLGCTLGRDLYKQRHLVELSGWERDGWKGSSFIKKFLLSDELAKDICKPCYAVSKFIKAESQDRSCRHCARTSTRNILTAEPICATAERFEQAVHMSLERIEVEAAETPFERE